MFPAIPKYFACFLADFAMLCRAYMLSMFVFRSRNPMKGFSLRSLCRMVIFFRLFLLISLVRKHVIRRSPSFSLVCVSRVGKFSRTSQWAAVRFSLSAM